MKINRIEYENFRNFKDHGEIICSTDGKITIIYGKNGDGKTTLHQLFHWIFYGKVSFNKTASDKLYNLKLEREKEYGDIFTVLGRIDFEHDNEQYSITRVFTYQKGVFESEKIKEEVNLQKMDNDNNWRRLNRPEEIIEKLLPTGLAEYFFFDGESMIADLRVKGKDSASKLRKALYSMFDLDILESAKDHIGRTDLKTTALGKLYLSKGTVSSSGDINATKTNIENAQNKIKILENDIELKNKEKEKNRGNIQNISEKIGTRKSKIEYEQQRRNLQNNRDLFLANAKMIQGEYGDAVLDMFPRLFVSKAVTDAKEKIHLQIEKNNLPKGLNKNLIKYLLLDSTTECICGNTLCERDKEHIQNFYKMLPPKSYSSLYNDFSKTAKSWGNGYDREKIESYIKNVLDNNERAERADIEIKELDTYHKESGNIDKLIEDRQKAENRIKEIDDELIDLNTEKNKYKIYLKKQMNEFDKMTLETSIGEAVAKKIDIMQEVCNYFNDRLERASEEYSKKLQDNIQVLLNQMLENKRIVSVSKDFSVRVTDSFNDESKSEGQFAVVSFAYIGGILKMLKSEEELAAKEYPLILDGPFSKLDTEKRQNVVQAIPNFAPQVIIFSKDDLNDVVENNKIGKVWTIKSNNEKNVAFVREGHLW